MSDCSRALDTPPGIYRIGHHETGEPFENNGTVGVLPGGDALASSIFALEHMVRVMARDTDAGLAEVIRMASLTPAERTGFAHDRGSLEPGKLADIVILSGDLHVQRTFINGIEVEYLRRQECVFVQVQARKCREASRRHAALFTGPFSTMMRVHPGFHPS